MAPPVDCTLCDNLHITPYVGDWCVCVARKRTLVAPAISHDIDMTGATGSSDNDQPRPEQRNLVPIFVTCLGTVSTHHTYYMYNG